MLFIKLAALALVPILAVATPMPQQTDQCNVGSATCCDSTQSASSADAALLGLLALLGIDVGSITGQIGLTCSPITVVGVSGTSCTSDPVCCTDDSFNGVVALGCTPVNLNL